MVSRIVLGAVAAALILPLTLASADTRGNDVYDSVIKDSSCSACSFVVVSPGYEATIGGGANNRDTAYGRRDFGGATGLAGRIYTRTVVRLAQGETLGGNLPVFQVRDTTNNTTVFQLVLTSSRQVRFASPAGGLRSTNITVNTGKTVPNDGTTWVRIEVSALRNESVTIRIDGVQVRTVSGLSGAKSGNPRSLWAGITSYAGTTTNEQVKVRHAGVNVSSTDWLGPFDAEGGPDLTPPGPPTNFAAALGADEVALSWLNPSEGDLDHVRIVRKADAEPESPSDGTVVCDCTGTQATDSLPPSGVTYHYAAYAVDASDNVSAPARTIGTAPPPPDQVHLAWVGNPATTLAVVWRTFDESVPSVVEYRVKGETTWQAATGAERSAGTEGKLHQVNLSSLTPNTQYEYRVRGRLGTWSPVFETRTAPSTGASEIDAVFVADTGLVGREDGLATGTQQVVDEIAALRPLLVLGGGDYAYFNTDKRYVTLDATIDAWFNQVQPFAAFSPFMPAYGNHETLLQEKYASWAARFPTPTGHDGRRLYSFDVGPVHFVSIYAVQNSTGLSASYLTWLENDLQSATDAGKRWIIPYFHVSPFADGQNHPSNLELRRQLGPLFERFGVKLAISSHDQAYERSYPLRDVPATNSPTSTSLSCYTMSDGVTWVKVSPGGKLSNKNGDFSQFATNPAPAWTAFRSNTLHTYARLRASDSELRFETFGVTGDGSPPVVVDSFRYAVAGC